MKSEERIKIYLEQVNEKKRAINAELNDLRAWTREDWDKVQRLFGKRMDLAITAGTLEWVLADDKVDD